MNGHCAPHLPAAAQLPAGTAADSLGPDRSLPSFGHGHAHSVIDLQRSVFLASSHPTTLGGARVVYFDKSARRVRRLLRRRAARTEGNSVAGSALDPGIDDAKTQCILEVAAQHPNFTADEVHAAIYYGRGRHDISKAMVRNTLASHRRTPVRRRLGR
jgi:hypothetical protein